MTEMPKPVLKKPKLKDYAAGIGNGKNLLKPVFPNRSKAKKPNNVRYEGEFNYFWKIGCFALSLNDTLIMNNLFLRDFDHFFVLNV